MKLKILIITTFFALLSCNKSSNHYHDGTYEFTIMGMKRTIILDGDSAKNINSITGTTLSKIQQYEDRIEYIEENGNVSIYYFLENGDLKVSDLIIFEKIKPNNK